jgi:hypothetical protein
MTKRTDSEPRLRDPWRVILFCYGCFLAGAIAARDASVLVGGQSASEWYSVAWWEVVAEFLIPVIFGSWYLQLKKADRE